MVDEELYSLRKSARGAVLISFIKARRCFMNILALIVCGVVATAIGFVWYGFLFMQPWAAGHKFTDAKSAALKKEMPITTGIAFIGYLVTAYVLSLILSYLQITDLTEALRITFLIWLGFPAMVTLMNTLYTGGSLVVYAIDTAYVLLYMLASATILTLWK